MGASPPARPSAAGDDRRLARTRPPARAGPAAAPPPARAAPAGSAAAAPAPALTSTSSRRTPRSARPARSCTVTVLPVHTGSPVTLSEVGEASGPWPCSGGRDPPAPISSRPANRSSEHPPRRSRRPRTRPPPDRHSAGASPSPHPPAAPDPMGEADRDAGDRPQWRVLKARRSPARDAKRPLAAVPAVARRERRVIQPQRLLPARLLLGTSSSASSSTKPGVGAAGADLLQRREVGVELLAVAAAEARRRRPGRARPRSRPGRAGRRRRSRAGSGSDGSISIRR